MPSIFRVDGQLQEHAFFRAIQHYAVPDYVKAAAVDEALPSDVDGFPSTVFGDPNTRSFPCHTKAACYLSAIDFAEQQDTLASPYAARVLTQLRKHAAAWGILPDVEAVRNKAAQLRTLDNSQLPDSDFAVVRRFDDGRKERAYPLRNASEIKAAASWLMKYAYELPYEDRHLIAERIIDRADDTGTSLPEAHYERLGMHAGLAVVSNAKLASAVRSRARLVRDSAIRDDLYKTAAAITAAGDDQIVMPDTASKIAANLDSIDRAYNLVPKYGRELLPPEEAIYVCSYKTAAASLNETVELVTGRVYHCDDLMNLNLPQIRDVLGADIADQCTGDGLFVDRGKFAEVAETLPRPDAEALTELLDQHGVSPLTKLAASAAGSPRLSTSDWAALAQL